VISVIIRILLIIAAYAVASLATGYVVYGSLLLYPTGGIGLDAKANDWGFGLMVAAFVAYFAIAPAAMVVAAGEFKSWRMGWYYALAGMVIGFGLGSKFSPPDWFAWLGLGFGPCAGLIFWGIAGRKAGFLNGTPRLVVSLFFLAVAITLFFITWAGEIGTRF
jgi:hypothetical protein